MDMDYVIIPEMHALLFMCFGIPLIPGQGRACKGTLYLNPRSVLLIEAVSMRVSRVYHESWRNSSCDMVKMTQDMIWDIGGISTCAIHFRLRKVHRLMWSLMVFNELCPREWLTTNSPFSVGSDKLILCVAKRKGREKEKSSDRVADFMSRRPGPKMHSYNSPFGCAGQLHNA